MKGMQESVPNDMHDLAGMLAFHDVSILTPARQMSLFVRSRVSSLILVRL